jgi:hypothetical protein
LVDSWAALAGAAQLSTNFVAYNLPGQTATNKATLLAAAQTSASTYAKKIASANGAGDVKSLTLLDADIQFGTTDSSGNYTALTGSGTVYPNTVKVVLRRDSSANGALPLFFAQVLGMSSANLTATATAAVYAGSVNSFSNTSFSSRILPMTFDVNHWNNFLSTGMGPDGTATFDSSGQPTINVYPSIKYDGNFGELSLDQGNDGASTISGWINNGVSGADLQNEISAGLLPLSVHNTQPAPTYTNAAPDWKGNPGLKDSTIKAVGDNIGQTYLLPLFKPVNSGATDPTTYQAGSGQGSNYYYTIVGFVGVKIVSVDSTGNPKSIYVQPSALIDPNALYTGVGIAQSPATGSSSLSTTFVGSRLTQ